MQHKDTNEGVSMSRRDVLRGATAVGAGMTGATAATGGAQGGSLTGGCLTDWPTESDRRIDVSGDDPAESATVPDSGDLLLYVHGLFGEDLLDSVNINGANQATALRQALEDEFEDREGSVPETAVAMWDSTTTWTVAKWRADGAGRTLAQWLDRNEGRYDSITLVGHSLGARVILSALNSVSTATVDSVALLGAAVNPDTICEEYKAGIERNVAGKVYNYHSDDDTIVCYIYAIREWTSALGCSGRDCGGGWFWSGSDPPANYEGVDVSGTVQGHCQYYRPDTEEFSGDNCVEELVENQLS